MVLVEDVESGNLASQFEVRVRDAAMWVGGTDQCCLGMQGETCPPGNGLEHRVGREPDTTHAGSTGIGGANGNGEIRDYLTNAGWSGAEVDSQVVQIGKGIRHWLPYADASLSVWVNPV